ncbi:MAG: hypothetical protein JXR23_10390 [Pontiellaceae bacterium]|nr:hypothetical protein [Pontiellaceae bacterium]
MKQFTLMIVSILLICGCSSSNYTQPKQTTIDIQKPNRERVIHISETVSFFPLDWDIETGSRTPPIINKPLELWDQDFRLISVTEEDGQEGVICLRLIPVKKTGQQIDR